MIEIDDIHREALAWFEQRAGQTVSWPDPLPNGQRLATLAKGIYKPGGWAHALSIKVIPAGPYADEEPQLDAEGRWRFRYNQEEPSNAEASTQYTNVGLARCMADQVPIGILRQVKPKPGPLYEIELGYVTEWSNGFFTIEGPARIGEVEYREQPERAAVSSEDARERILTAITRRRGQAVFRSRLLVAYRGQCAISDCRVEAVLEAAHIVPYRGQHTNETSNGLLLRADLHTLFDLDLMRIDPDARSVILDATLRGSIYDEFDGRPLRLPERANDQPAPANLLARAALLGAGSDIERGE